MAISMNYFFFLIPEGISPDLPLFQTPPSPAPWLTRPPNIIVIYATASVRLDYFTSSIDYHGNGTTACLLHRIPEPFCSPFPGLPTVERILYFYKCHDAVEVATHKTRQRPWYRHLGGK
ncbi:hypothetical protein J6590_017628 [Homalodisca vitripennis]|nr:hypothetical protein J6590_017628 [Homalodisca vitripennis]